MPNPVSMKKALTLPNGMTVCEVDGGFVRDNLSVEFALGGHHHVYDFIPENQIWVETVPDEDDWWNTVLHELVEHELMSGGMEYDEAHELSSGVETECRRTRMNIPKELVAVVEEVVGHSRKAVLTSGLWAYTTLMWQKVAEDLAKEMAKAFGHYADIYYKGGTHDGLTVAFRGVTRGDYLLEGNVIMFLMDARTYEIQITASRPDWGKHPSTVVQEKYNFADFSAKDIAKMVAERVL